MPHVRIRCTGLIVKKDAVLLVEYDDNGVHYNLPGGGLEPGETIVEGVAREIREETTAEVEVGRLALVYEMAPHKQSGDYGRDEKHGLHLIFECALKEGSEPKLPPLPDPHQSAVKWVPVTELDSVLLIPNIAPQLISYLTGDNRDAVFVEDYRLERLRIET